MPKPRLTAALKRRITEDWLAALPGLAVYRPMHRLRRVGPLLVGVLLERTSSGDEYRPTFHVHSLLGAPFMTLTLARRLRSARSDGPDSISVRGHASRHVEAARELERQSPLALAGPLRLDDVLAAYRMHASIPGTHYDANVLFADMASLAAWCGERASAQRAIDDGLAALATWPPAIATEIGGAEQWRRRLASDIADRSRLVTTLERAIATLGVAHLPAYELLR